MHGSQNWHYESTEEYGGIKFHTSFLLILFLLYFQSINCRKFKRCICIEIHTKWNDIFNFSTLWPHFRCKHKLEFRLVVLFDSVQGIWKMEGKQLGRGAERFSGVSVASDPRVHQEHPTPGPQTHHPDDHWQSDQEVWNTLPVVSNIGR